MSTPRELPADAGVDGMPACFCNDVLMIVYSGLPPFEVHQLVREYPPEKKHKFLRYCADANPNEWYEYAMTCAGYNHVYTRGENFYACLSPRVTRVTINHASFPPQCDRTRYISWLQTLKLEHIEAHDWFRETTMPALHAKHVEVYTDKYVIACESATVYNIYAVLPPMVKTVVLKCDTVLPQTCRPAHVTMCGFISSFVTPELIRVTVSIDNTLGMNMFLECIQNVSPECEVIVVANTFGYRHFPRECPLRLKTNLPMITGPRVTRTNEPCELGVTYTRMDYRGNDTGHEQRRAGMNPWFHADLRMAVPPAVIPYDIPANLRNNAASDDSVNLRYDA